MIATLTIGKRRAGRPSASGSMPHYLRRFAQVRPACRRPADCSYEASSLGVLIARDPNTLLAQEIADPSVVPAHGRQSHVAVVAMQHDLAAPAITAKDGLV